jgi:TPR repeat protein
MLVGDGGLERIFRALSGEDALLLNGLLYLLASAAPLSFEMGISPAVQAVAAKYGKNFGPQAEKELESLRANGDRTAAALLGELLMFPDRAGGPDFARSCDQSEAAGRHASALHNLATCYFAGQRRPRDLNKARELYGQAAGLGMPKSKCAFGNMLVRGDGGPAEPARGVELCRQAADTGESDAQTDYGGYLLTDRYVAKDAVAARRYLTLAAEAGHRNAAFLLGQIYWNGDGIDKNVPQAAIWWITAYEKGRTDAPLLIGTAAFSLIVEAAKTKEPIATVVIDQARRWLAIAADQDTDALKREKAKELLRLLEELLAGR